MNWSRLVNGSNGLAETDFSAVTETSGHRVTQQALSMLYTRYLYAAGFCKDKKVLEVACGAGHGLGYLAKRARQIVGGDVTSNLLNQAQRATASLVPLVRLNAQGLPFRALSFDVILFYEAIYYLTQPEQFLDECRRILRPDGLLILCTVNPEWSDFNPSPFSVRYFSATELSELLVKRGFRVQLQGGFPVARASFVEGAISFLKRVAVAFHLIPKTMKGKEFLKRIFLGKLVRLPSQVEDGAANYLSPAPLSPSSKAMDYKVIYALAYV
jgi:ubiquinone/menaquinone biosynthesis C-methylase UbiE